MGSWKAHSWSVATLRKSWKIFEISTKSPNRTQPVVRRVVWDSYAVCVHHTSIFLQISNFFKPTPNSRRLHTVMSGTSWEIVIFYPLGCLWWVHSLRRTMGYRGRVTSPFWAVEPSRAIRFVSKKRARNAYFTETWCQVQRSFAIALQIFPNFMSNQLIVFCNVNKNSWCGNNSYVK